MAEADQNRALVKQIYARFAAGDVPAVLAAFASDIAWTEAEGSPYAGTFVGAEAIVQSVFMRLATEWDGYTVAADSYVAEGDTVVALGHYSGRHLKSGKSYRAPFAHVWTLRDGKAARFVEYTDTVLLQQAVA